MEIHITLYYGNMEIHIDGLVQDCSNSSALAMELLQSCARLSARMQYVQGDSKGVTTVLH